MRLRAARCLPVLLVLAAGAAPAAPSLRFDGDAGIGYDSNADNAPRHQGGVGSGTRTAGLSADASQIVTNNLALGARLQVQGEDVWDVDGLSSVKGTAMLRAALRPGGGFHAPTLTGWGSAALWEFDSALRDSHELRCGLRVDQPLTTRLGLRANLWATRRMADSPVFDLDSQFAALSMEWLATERMTVRLGYDYGKGEIVSTALPRARLQVFAEAFTLDDAFDDARRAYRVQAHTQIARTGLNWRLTPRLAVDLDLQGVQSDSHGGTEYRRARGLLSLLARF